MSVVRKSASAGVSGRPFTRSVSQRTVRAVARSLRRPRPSRRRPLGHGAPSPLPAAPFPEHPEAGVPLHEAAAAASAGAGGAEEEDIFEGVGMDVFAWKFPPRWRSFPAPSPNPWAGAGGANPWIGFDDVWDGEDARGRALAAKLSYISPNTSLIPPSACPPNTPCPMTPPPYPARAATPGGETDSSIDGEDEGGAAAAAWHNPAALYEPLVNESWY